MTGKAQSQFNPGASGSGLQPSSLTDRKKKKVVSKNRSNNNLQALPQSTSKQDGLTMSSLQGEISKQMSLPSFKHVNANR